MYFFYFHRQPELVSVILECFPLQIAQDTDSTFSQRAGSGPAETRSGSSSKATFKGRAGNAKNKDMGRKKKHLGRNQREEKKK